MRSASSVIVATFLLACTCACRQAKLPDPYHTVLPGVGRSLELARQANQRGLALADEGDFDAAEGAFRAALRADLNYAAAHNNLGLALLAKGAYYQSALEFSFAIKLNRRAVEPLLNLASLYEKIGWYEASVAQYEKAIELEPNNVEVMGRLAHAYIRAGKGGESVTGLLQTLVAKDVEEKWKSWAVAQLKR